MSHTLDYLLEPIAPWLDDETVEDVCIQRPNEVWVYSRGTFTKHDLDLDEFWTEDLAIVAGASRRQDINAKRPLLATGFSTEDTRRLQAVVYPCVAMGRTALVMRRGSKEWPSLDRLEETGLFNNTKSVRQTVTNQLLLDLYREAHWSEFLRLAVRLKKNIILCGETGSGKTHIAKALLSEVPLSERLITIEDAPELLGLPHPNSVALYYDKHGNGTTAADLVEASLRMRIGRLFVQEIRDGKAAIAFLVALQTGHAGGITTIHASDCQSVFNRIRFVVKQTPWGAAISDADIIAQLHSLIDVVVHAERGGDGSFAVDEVWYRDACKDPN